jgi:hypothetical protein
MDRWIVRQSSAERPQLGASALSVLWKLLSRSDRSRLDMETMSDQVKRDLGFLDGRDPRHEDELMR